MRPVVGIICEYDPFHLGHKRQFALVREKLPDAAIICVMSGCFTQRGMPALFAPAVRAKAALEAGADVVLELPCAFAVRDAENFALGGVALLSALGFVTHLCFGAEDGLEALLPAAGLLNAPTPAFDRALQTALQKGHSFASAQGQALKECLGASVGGAPAPWEKPNNILALCYLRAIARLKSPLAPLCVRREGDYHAQALGDQPYPSATAVRQAYLQGDTAAAQAACGYALPLAPVCRPDALDKVLLYKLRTQSAQELAALPDCTEGLENRLKDCTAKAATREEMLSLLKTKRYAYARLSRLVCHALLDVTADLLRAHPVPEYARLLGLRREAQDVRALLKQSSVPILAKAADGDAEEPLFRLDVRAYDLWALGAGAPQGLWFTQGVAVV